MNEEIRSIVEEHLKIFAKALIDVVDSGRYIGLYRELFRKLEA